MTYSAIAKELETKFLKDYGVQCPDFYLNCPTCQAWMAFEIILDAAAIENVPGWNEVYKNRKQHKNKTGILND